MPSRQENDCKHQCFVLPAHAWYSPMLGITYSTGTFTDGAAYISPAASLWLRFSLR